jgi:hypothetical protein
MMLEGADVLRVGVATIFICGIVLWLVQVIFGTIKDWLRG